ncbi:MAG: AAA family ATPase [Bacteroidota bacterium]
MPSPFKFLDAYTREDRDQFFGREEETAQLFELVNENRLVLLYGPSGTGKTSLIQCGLGNRFEATDWLPLFVRRGAHLPSSLQRILLEHWDEELTDNFWLLDENPLPSIIEDLFAEYLRPIYLIFDQLEEIFILGDEEEQRIFTETMANIYQAKLPCRLVFILREEYLAHLYDFEQRIPTLFKRRLRVEAMSGQQAEEVVRMSCNRFNIRLQDPDNNPAQIISKVAAGRSGVPLPYLQVYMDRLYREDFARTYPKTKETGDPSSSTDWPSLEFTTAEIEEFGEIGDVLKAFLQEQTQQIQKDLSEQFPDFSERAVRRVLSAFATLLGTKIPRLRAELQVPPLPDSHVDAILDRLQQARILREEEGTYELAHDTLAGEIASQRSGSEQALLEVAEVVHNRFRAFGRTKTYLDAKELQLIETYENQLREEQKLSAGEWEFILESQREVRLKKQRRNQLTLAVIAVLSVMLIFAFSQWQVAKGQKELAEKREAQADSARDEADSARINAEQARQEAELEKRKAQQALRGFYQEQLKGAQNTYNISVAKLNDGLQLYPDQNDIIRNRRQQVRQTRQVRDNLQAILDSLDIEINR